MHRIWIIDDEPTICWALKKELEKTGAPVEVFASAEACVEQIRNSAPLPAVVLLDVRLPGQSGLDLLEILQALPSNPAVIVMTAFGDLKVAVEALRGRAFEYLTKPFDMTTILNVVRRAIESRSPTHAPAAVPPLPALTRDTMLGESPAMQGVYKQIAIAAQSDAPVLIDGETGTGKSLVARMIHRFSPRANEPLVFFRPDPEHGAESDAELFGTCLPSMIPSSSMGPIKQPGLMLLAGMGTLVIDEVVDLSIASQAKLLGAIESGVFQAIASATPDPLRARFLFTSSVDWEGACHDGELYEPFAAQIRVLHVRLPPLRERREDIRILAHAFLESADSTTDASGLAKQWSETALQILEHQSWPGNVRQLRQAIQTAKVRARGSVIQPEDLPAMETPDHDRLGSGSMDDDLAHATRTWLKTHSIEMGVRELSETVNAGFLYDQFLSVAEKALIQGVLEECGGNRAAVAARLGIHRTTLRQKMKRYGL